jgi:hypothetical protein
MIKIFENLENFRKKGQKLQDGLSGVRSTICAIQVATWALAAAQSC